MVIADRLECPQLAAAGCAYYPAFFASETVDWFGQLREELDWQREDITLFGRRVEVPRLTAFYGEPGVRYRYSGTEHRAEGWHPLLEQIRRQLEAALQTRFNAVLGNLYRDGHDYMGWHSDDERELGPAPTIASVSMGAVRPFCLRRRSNPRERVTQSLADGSLLVMHGSSQSEWQHALPKRRRIMAPRINLTYRYFPAR